MNNEKLELEALVYFGCDDICVVDDCGYVYSVIDPKDYDVNNYREINMSTYYKRVRNKEHISLVVDIVSR